MTGASLPDRPDLPVRHRRGRRVRALLDDPAVARGGHNASTRLATKDERADSPLGMRSAAELWIRRLCIEPAGQILDVLDEIAPDLWFVHPSLYWLTEMAAARTATPIVVGHLFPMMIPSAEQPPPTLPAKGGRRLNRLAWRMARTMAGRMMYDGQINRLRTERGLDPVTGNVGFGWQQSRRTLLLSSEHYWPRPSDWPEQVVMTGFTVWDGGGASLPDGLASYLDAGPAPVLITFGTSAATNAGEAFTQVAGVVEAGGHRALLLVGNDRWGSTRSATQNASTSSALARRCRSDAAPRRASPMRSTRCCARGLRRPRPELQDDSTRRTVPRPQPTTSRTY